MIQLSLLLYPLVMAVMVHAVFQIKELQFENQINNLSYEKNKSILILEPNLSIIKNCLLPLYIVENYERKHPNILNSCNIMGGKGIVDNHYFIRLILLEIF